MNAEARLVFTSSFRAIGFLTNQNCFALLFGIQYKLLRPTICR